MRAPSTIVASRVITWITIRKSDWQFAMGLLYLGLSQNWTKKIVDRSRPICLEWLKVFNSLHSARLTSKITCFFSSLDMLFNNLILLVMLTLQLESIGEAICNYDLDRFTTSLASDLFWQVWWLKEGRWCQWLHALVKVTTRFMNALWKEKLLLSGLEQHSTVQPQAMKLSLRALIQSIQVAMKEQSVHVSLELITTATLHDFPS